MLTRIETLLLAPLQAALGPAVRLVVGDAGQPPGDAPQPQLALRVARLARVPPSTDGEAAPGREPAQATTTLLLQADAGDPRHVTLPPGTTGQVTEVQSPPGRLLPQADAWIADATGLRFLTAPTAPVRLTLRGPAVRGYQERWPARIDLDLVAWATGADAASDLLGRGLAALLDTLFERDLIDLQEAPPAGGLSLRLLRPVAQLQGMERGSGLAGTTAWHRVAATVAVQGEAVLALALGAADPAATIRRIEFGLDHPRADGTVGHDAGSIGG